MRFLALTSLQSALLSAFTALTILALYFLKHKRQRVVISSVLLWRRVIENRLDNSIFEKLRRVLSIVIAIVTALLVAMAIARPEIDALTGTARRAMIIMDTSPTMQTRTRDRKTRWQHAVERARALVDSGTVGTRFRIADTTNQLAAPFTADHAELRRQIDRLHPAIAQPQIPEVDTTVQDVYVITDGVSPLSIPAGTISLSVFEPAPNVGITAFEIRSTPSSAPAYEAYLEVSNFGRDAQSVDINVSGPGQQRIARTTRLIAGQTYREALDLSQFDGGGIRAAVHSSVDAYSLDDLAYGYLPVKRRTKTLLVTRGNKLIQTALELDPFVDLTVTNPDGYNSNGDFDAFVFDGYAPAAPPPRPALILGAQNTSWLRRSTGTIERPVVESTMAEHPVLQAVSLHDVSFGRAARIDASNLTILAATTGNAPLIVASEQPRWIMLTFDLRDSDFPYHSAFPLFIDNAIAWFSRDRLALTRSPGVVEVPIAGAQVRTIDGRPIPAQDLGSATTFEADDPGLYIATGANQRQYIAVNFTDRRFSSINNSQVRESKRTLPRTAMLDHELWVYMLFAALLLIGAEWFTYHRRITL